MCKDMNNIYMIPGTETFNIFFKYLQNRYIFFHDQLSVSYSKFMES